MSAFPHRKGSYKCFSRCQLPIAIQRHQDWKGFPAGYIVFPYNYKQHPSRFPLQDKSCVTGNSRLRYVSDDECRVDILCLGNRLQEEYLRNGDFAIRPTKSNYRSDAVSTKVSRVGHSPAIICVSDILCIVILYVPYMFAGR